MEFVLKQEKLEDMLEKLMVKDILPKSVLVAKGKEIMSVQKEEHARAFRFLKLKEGYFESIKEVEDEESIEIDVKKILGLIKKIPSNMDITWKTKKNKIELTAENRKFGLAIVEPEEVEKKLPFTLEKGAPTWDDESLEVNFSINIGDFKEVSDYASSLSTEFFQIHIEKKNKLEVRVGDIHDFTEYGILTIPNIDIKNGKGKDLAVTFTYAIPEIADTFRDEVMVWAGTNMPAWFYEKTDEHFLGILVPPYTEEEE